MGYTMEMPKLRPTLKVDEWVLLEDWTFYSDRLGCEITVKKGFRSDLDSVPRIPVLYSQLKGFARLAAIAHDWLYTTGEITGPETEEGIAGEPVDRDTADKVFNEIMRKEGISSLRRWFIYYGVRFFGWVKYRPDINRVSHLYQNTQ